MGGGWDVVVHAMDPLHGVTLSSDHATIRVPWIQVVRSKHGSTTVCHGMFPSEKGRRRMERRRHLSHIFLSPLLHHVSFQFPSQPRSILRIDPLRLNPSLLPG